MARSAVQSPQDSSSLSGFFDFGFTGILFGAGFSKALDFGAGVQSPQESLSESEEGGGILCLLCKKHCVL